MKNIKYLLLLSCILTLSVAKANPYSINHTDVINVSTGYINNMTEVWNVTSNDLAKPLKVSYTIGTEANWDFLEIYSIDNQNNAQLILKTSGTNSGVLTTKVPSGKARIIFRTDGSVNHQSNPAQYFGINVSFAVDNDIHFSSSINAATNMYVNGSLGIGTLSPMAPLHITKTQLIEGETVAAILGAASKEWTYFGGNKGGRIRGSNEGYLALEANPKGTGDKRLYFNIGNSSDIIMNYHGGNVAIGKSLNPAEKLTIAGGHTDTKFRLTSTGDGASSPANLSLWASEPGLTYYGTGIGYNVNGSPSNGRIDTNRGSSYIRFLPGETKFMFQTTANTTVDALTLNENGNIQVNGNIQLNGRIGTGLNDAFTYDDKTMGHYSMGWFNDTWSGHGPTLWQSGFGGIKFFTGSNNRMTINVAGHVGIGTDNIQSNLHLVAPASYVPINAFTLDVNSFSTVENMNVSTFFRVRDIGAGTTPFVIKGNGNVGIGTDAPDHLLTVKGTIHAREVLVDLNGPLADYVFEPDYTLMPLSEVESFVKANKHLPEIPSAAEVKENGLNMGEMQNKLLQKIEELTLYVIELQKTNEKQNAEIEALKQVKK